MSIFGKIKEGLQWRFGLARQGIYENRMRRKYLHFGSKSRIQVPCEVNNARLMHIGDNVCIRNNAWIYAKANPEVQGPNLYIGDNSYIGRFAHICAYHKVHIGKNALIADKVFITSADHGYEDIDQPIRTQKLKLAPVAIGEDTWIGENAVILPGVTIGKHCVVAANSVVKRDVPDYSVVAGQPAKVIKLYDTVAGKWVKPAVN